MCVCVFFLHEKNSTFFAINTIIWLFLPLANVFFSSIIFFPNNHRNLIGIWSSFVYFFVNWIDLQKGTIELDYDSHSVSMQVWLVQIFQRGYVEIIVWIKWVFFIQKWNWSVCNRAIRWSALNLVWTLFRCSDRSLESGFFCCLVYVPPASSEQMVLYSIQTLSL